MRKAMLNSSQVSFLASALVVVLCTSALFLSGYAIQQRTLRELREAIRPREVPKPFLRDRFQPRTTTLQDGTVMFGSEAKSQEEPMAEIRPSSFEAEEAALPRTLEQRQEEGAAASTRPKATRRQMEMMEQIVAHAAKKSWAVENPDPEAKDRAPVSRAQRRKMIKDELRKMASYSENPNFYQRRLW